MKIKIALTSGAGKGVWTGQGHHRNSWKRDLPSLPWKDYLTCLANIFSTILKWQRHRSQAITIMHKSASERLEDSPRAWGMEDRWAPLLLFEEKRWFEAEGKLLLRRSTASFDIVHMVLLDRPASLFSRSGKLYPAWILEMGNSWALLSTCHVTLICWLLGCVP